MGIDELAMKIITDKLVDPWHRTFARDVVEMYLKYSNKHLEKHPDDHRAIGTRIDEDGNIIQELRCIYKDCPEHPPKHLEDK